MHPATPSISDIPSLQVATEPFESELRGAPNGTCKATAKAPSLAFAAAGARTGPETEEHAHTDTQYSLRSMIYRIYIYIYIMHYSNMYMSIRILFISSM